MRGVVVSYFLVEGYNLRIRRAYMIETICIGFGAEYFCIADCGVPVQESLGLSEVCCLGPSLAIGAL